MRAARAGRPTRLAAWWRKRVGLNLVIAKSSDRLLPKVNDAVLWMESLSPITMRRGSLDPLERAAAYALTDVGVRGLEERLASEG